MDTVVKAAKIPAAEEDKGAAPKAAPRFIGDAGKTGSHKLAYPLEWDGNEYHEATLDHLRGKDFGKLRMLTKMGVSEDVALIHLVTKLPVEVVDALHADDYVELMELSKAFIPARFLEEKA